MSAFLRGVLCFGFHHHLNFEMKIGSSSVNCVCKLAGMRKKEYLEPKISQQRFLVMVIGGNGFKWVLGFWGFVFLLPAGGGGVVVVLVVFCLVVVFCFGVCLVNFLLTKRTDGSL